MELTMTHPKDSYIVFNTNKRTSQNCLPVEPSIHYKMNNISC